MEKGHSSYDLGLGVVGGLCAWDLTFRIEGLAFEA